MTDLKRRDILKAMAGSMTGAAALAGLHPSIARALSIPADVRTGTLKDVAHVVILTQENRSFDHYFGTLSGVQGFGDRFALPVGTEGERDDRTVFVQSNVKPAAGAPKQIAPFALMTRQTFAHMRVEGTPHSFTDAQAAW
ncbi:MAG: alkaline phosphatase family protein, partial [Asticcacaulis sp.]